MKEKMEKNYLRKNVEKKVHKDEVNLRMEYAANSDIADILKRFGSTIKGIEKERIKFSREKYGKNKVTHGKKKSLFKKMCDAFVNPFTAILFCLAVVSGITDIAIPIYNNIPEDVDIMTVTIILTMVIISGVLRFVQEARSNNAAEKLLEMITTTTCVERLEDGKKEIPLG